MTAQRKDRAPKGGPVPWETEWGHGDSEGDSTTSLSHGQQPSLADALAERDQAARNAENSLHTGWRLWAEHELDRLITSGSTFTADDLRAVVGDPPDGEHVNGIGGLFLRASKAGRIEFAGYAVSTRPAARGRPVRCWRGAQHVR